VTRAPGPAGLPRLLAGLDPLGAPMGAADHARVHGPLPRLSAGELIDEVQRSGLRGRGGADFPAATKLLSMISRRRAGVLVINGSETEPASGKDQLLLSRLPNLVLDGAVLVATALGAPEIVVKIRDAELGAMPALAEAVAVRDADGRRAPRIRLVAGPDGYVTGEETAVVRFLNGGPPLPAFTPPRPFERGYRGRPTLVHNPETLAQVALVARHGARWYRELGTEADPGSALITISGAVAAPGVYELSFGTPLADLLEAAGGPAEPLQAILIGGYFGSWVAARHATRLRLAREDLRSIGCSLGSGVMIALGDSACGLHESARLIGYLADQSAGQCGPCVHGLRAIAETMTALLDGDATPRHGRERLLRWAGEIRGRGACHHPDGATRLLESALAVFGHDLERHLDRGCPAPSAGLPLGPPLGAIAVAGSARR
jgi:NADH:ubiquinone oxidoreductase subunit F (NADH-binding)